MSSEYLRQPSPPWWMREERERRNLRNGRDPAKVVSDLIDASIRIADAEGFAALSMRRVAAELGMGTMSLYSYVETKDDVLDLIYDRVMGEALLDPEEQVDWRTGITAIAHRFRRMCHAHPWVIRLMSMHASFCPNLVRHLDQSLGVFAGLDVDRDTAMAILGTVDDFVIGRVQREQSAAETLRRTGMTEGEWIEGFLPYIRKEATDHGLTHVLELLDGEDLPEFGNQDAEFEVGLELILAGAEAQMAAAAKRKKPKVRTAKR